VLVNGIPVSRGIPERDHQAGVPSSEASVG